MCLAVLGVITSFVIPSWQRLQERHSVEAARDQLMNDLQTARVRAIQRGETLQWKTANQVTDMAQVLAIEVCLRVASINTVHNTKPNSHLKGCQDEAFPSDGRVRRTFRRVMALRNREEVMP